MGDHMAKLSCRTVFPGVKLSAQHNGSSDSRAVSNTEKIIKPLCRAKSAFAQRGGIHVVFHRNGTSEDFAQRFPDLRPGVTRNVIRRIKDRAVDPVHLTAGRHADRFKRAAVLPHKGDDPPKQRLAPLLGMRRGLFLVKKLSFAGNNPVLDACSANVKHKSLFHGALHSFPGQTGSYSTAVNRRVISSGRVIAPPTTAHHAPASSALRSCSG